MKVIKTTKRKGIMVLGFETPEATARANGNPRQTSATGDEAAERIEDATAPGSQRSGQAAIKRKRKTGGLF